MKLRTLVSLSLAAALYPAFIPTPAIAAPPPGEKPGKPERQPGMRDLTPAERQQLNAAREKVMTDPAVVAANQDNKAVQQEYQSVVEKALLQQDPSLGPILDKLKQPPAPGTNPPPPPPPPAPADATGAKPEKKHARKPHEGKEWGAAMRNLTPEERVQLRKAHKAVESTPAVKQAEEKKQTANKQFRETYRAALLKVDPTLGPILDKMEAAEKEHPHPMGRRAGPPAPPAPPASPAPPSGEAPPKVEQ